MVNVWTNVMELVTAVITRRANSVSGTKRAGHIEKNADIDFSRDEEKYLACEPCTVLAC